MADISNKQDRWARVLKWLVLAIMIAGALTNYDSLAWQMRYVWKNEKPVAVMYTNVSQEELDIRTGNLLAWFKEVKRIEKPYLRVYLYDPKPDK